MSVTVQWTEARIAVELDGGTDVGSLSGPRMLAAARQKMYGDDGKPPALLFNVQAVVDCGCLCAVGLRYDNHEPSAAAIPCELHGHRAKMGVFMQAFKHSLASPSDRPAVEVAAELLAKEYEVPVQVGEQDINPNQGSAQ